MNRYRSLDEKQNHQSSRSLSPPNYKKTRLFENVAAESNPLMQIKPPLPTEQHHFKKSLMTTNRQENSFYFPSQTLNKSSINNSIGIRGSNAPNSLVMNNFYENNSSSEYMISDSKFKTKKHMLSTPQTVYPQQVFKSIYSNDDSKCHACGDKSTGSHFGGLSCESCKAFFRRSVQNDRYLEYKCTYQNSCEMNINTRKICQACRYKTCLNIGMKPKWVLSDTERLQKYGSRRRKLNNSVTSGATEIPFVAPIKIQNPIKSEPISTESSQSVNIKINEENNDSYSSSSEYDNKSESSLQQQSSPSITKSTRILNSQNSFSSTDQSNYDHLKKSLSNIELKQRLEEEFYKNGIDSIDISTLKILDYDVIFIDKIVYAYFYARQMHEINMSKLNMEMASTANSGENVEALQRSSKISAANFIREPIKRLVTFSKLLPEFRTLQLHDQVSLLRSSAIEMMICSSINLFDSNTNTLKNVISRDRNIEAKEKQAVKLNLLKSIWPENVFIQTIKYLKSMVELNIDEATLVLYLPLILFAPDRRDLSNRNRILDLQAKYSMLLYKYLLRQKQNATDADRIYRILLIKLCELRELHVLHSSILIDIGIDNIDEYPQEVLKNAQKESMKLRFGNLNFSNSPSSGTTESTTYSNINSHSSSSIDFSPSLSYSAPPSSSQTDFDFS